MSFASPMPFYVPFLPVSNDYYYYDDDYFKFCGNVSFVELRFKGFPQPFSEHHISTTSGIGHNIEKTNHKIQNNFVANHKSLNGTFRCFENRFVVWFIVVFIFIVVVVIFTMNGWMKLYVSPAY